MTAPLCLIVDDEPALRTYLSVILEKRGLQSLEAESAVEALRILQSLGNEIDLLISDIQMPGDMDGIDLAYSVRTRFSCIPVILISGEIEGGPADFPFVRKPFRAEQILRAVDRVLSKTSASSGR